ncbi:hypothetical protein [Methanosphaerula palustris]|uniref:Uncharacterized protein n=1 Tax=Methanosphaerula palustris (strain ATCC BAA-1556 / DSM 19958 / E1-9c) TaxID=521011 RepID=B8GK46_METPE|nr:hypothetical protein [Methanosphaerula palustris]ACL17117.1 hypothetical protein Mpal_1811 [Methanosphaerula palustris E1-9c]
MIVLLLSVGMVAFSPVAAIDIPYHHTWIDMTNGAFWSNLSSGGLNQSYYVKYDSGGNQIHITNSPLVSAGQVNHNYTASGSESGTFYLADNGGRGFNDDLVLMVAVQHPVPSGFSLGINASGYRWQPTAVLNQVPAKSDLHYVNGAVNQYFTASNFSEYTSQDQKPNSVAGYDIFDGQGTSTDPSYDVSFIDLNLGDLGSNYTVKYADSLINNGTVKVDYNVTGLTSGGEDIPLAYNVYAWCNQSNAGKGISWTNALSTTGASGLDINNPYE